MLLLKLAEIFGDVARTAESLIALTGDDYICFRILTCELASRTMTFVGL